MKTQIVCEQTTEAGELQRFELLSSEFASLLEALRRDLRHERSLQEFGPAGDRATHGYIAHLDVRLLETLNPKRPRSEEVAELYTTFDVCKIDIAAA